MNAIGPIEAEMKANHAAVRSRLFAEPKRIVKVRKEPKVETPRQRLASIMEAKRIVSKYRRFDVIYAPHATRKWRIDAIKQQVASKHGVSIACLESASRNPRFVKARQEGYYRVRHEIEGMSYPMIGRCFGGRDHTTVLHGERKHIERMKAGKA